MVNIASGLEKLCPSAAKSKCEFLSTCLQIVCTVVENCLRNLVPVLVDISVFLLGGGWVVGVGGLSLGLLALAKSKTL